MRRMHALPGASLGTRKLRGRSVFREGSPVRNLFRRARAAARRLADEQFIPKAAVGATEATLPPRRGPLPCEVAMTSSVGEAD